MKVGFISLGCSKNLVDTEMIIGLFKNNKYEIVNNIETAEIIVINTCGFIESAKEESINTILEIAELKNKKNCKYIIVTGCLVQRYKEELSKLIPEIDLFLKIDEYADLWQEIEKLLNTKNIKNYNLEYTDRVITTGNKTAYLKIAEGCDNKCTYCAIPKIRGPYISRKKEDIVEEAKQLAGQGINEIIIIAQDTSKYGLDIYGKLMLADLLNDISNIENIKWIRFLYTYPESITDELINTVKNNDKICKYFDIPIQHISNKVLKLMNRKTNKKDIEDLIIKLRKEIKDVVIRTTVMVGFPEETEKDFLELYNFINWAKFDNLGAFTYSKEEDTAAYNLKNQIHYKTKQKRYNIIMKKQNEIVAENLKNKIGKEYVCLIEGISRDNKFYVGRTYMNVPDMDGIIFVKKHKNVKIGDFLKIKITDFYEYDMFGEIV